MKAPTREAPGLPHCVCHHAAGSKELDICCDVKLITVLGIYHVNRRKYREAHAAARERQALPCGFHVLESGGSFCKNEGSFEAVCFLKHDEAFLQETVRHLHSRTQDVKAGECS